MVAAGQESDEDIYFHPISFLQCTWISYAKINKYYNNPPPKLVSYKFDSSIVLAEENELMILISKSHKGKSNLCLYILIIEGVMNVL